MTRDVFIQHPKMFCFYLSNHISLRGRFVFKLFSPSWSWWPICDSVWLCIALYGYMWLSMNLFTFYDPILWWVTLNDWVIVNNPLNYCWLCLTLYDSVWLWITLLESVLFCLFLIVQFYSTLFKFAWIYSTLLDFVKLTQLCTNFVLVSGNMCAVFRFLCIFEQKLNTIFRAGHSTWIS